MRGGNRRGHVRKTDAVCAGIAAVLLIAALGVAAFALHGWEARRYAVTASADSVSGLRVLPERRTAAYNGKTYIQRAQLKTYLLMGIDVEGPATGSKSYVGGGQADVQMLLVVDHANKTWQVLQLNRDTMAEVQVLGVNGAVVNTVRQQLTLAHAYGDGLKQSCQNAVTAVSALLGGQTIDGYMSVNMDAVAILNDLAGGVPIEITSDFSAVDPSLPLGGTVTLQGAQALTFVRSRKAVDDETNAARMARQRQYLQALQKQIAGQDAKFAVRAYDAIADYMVTDIGSGTATEIGQYMQDYAEQPLLTIAGTPGLNGEGSTTYEPDADSLQQTILTLFYQEQG